ncbi:Bgt-20471 [Blumeria graminis f. sp. tritici]|uniref:Bgt-20471 n=1 Tax=Blumeria graminis f. sp. tritici TaxID=62690 RepID=A0A9X9MPG4_BLUGR|nr:Bgt-20471 [Blumeria graminis f. sp. tritici]
MRSSDSYHTLSSRARNLILFPLSTRSLAHSGTFSILRISILSTRCGKQKKKSKLLLSVLLHRPD